MHRLVLAICLTISVLVLAGPAAAGPEGSTPSPILQTSPGAVQTSGDLKWVELSIGGRPFKVNSGGVVSLHPDAPFRVVDAKTGTWLDFGLTYRLEGLSDVDPTRFHSLAELLGDEVYRRDHLDLYVLRGGDILGSVRLLITPLPIDWLRRAQDSKRPEDQIRFLRKALELTPDDPLLVRRLADLLVESGRYREAVELLEGQAAQSDDPERLRRLAGLYQRLGQWDKAAGAYSKLWAESPRDPELGWTLAGLYQGLGRWDEAVTVLERLTSLETGPAQARAWAHLGVALGKAGRPAEALQALEKSVQIAPGDAGLWRALAAARRASGNEPEALSALARAAGLSPDDRGLRLELAEGLLAAGRKKAAAREMATLAFNGQPEPALLTRLAGIYQELDDREGLARVYRALAKLNPDDPDLRYNLGVIYSESGDPAQALAQFQEAAKAKPDDPEVRARIFETLAALGRWEQAVEMARHMQKARPDDPALMELFFAQLGQHRPADMARLLDAYLAAAKPKESRPYQMRAGLALAMNDDDGVIRALERGVAANPQDLDMLAKLAAFYESRGQDAKALELYGRIVDRDPDYPEVMERYMQLKTLLLEQKNHNQPAPAPPSAPPPGPAAKPGQAPPKQTKP